MKAKVHDVVVIGGGISGVAAAYELARAGIRVALVEKGELASMASGWTLAGVRQSGRDPAELPLAQAAVRRWEHLAEELDADIEYRQEGNLRLARTPEEVEWIRNMVAQQQALGLELEFLPDTQAVREVAPALSDAVLAASFCPTDGHANPIATVQAYARAAERAGAQMLFQTKVTRIDASGGKVQGVQTTVGPLAADAVILAAGIYSDRLCATVDVPLPLHLVHVGVVQTVPQPPLLAQVLGVANADVAGRQEVGGRLRFTASTGPWTHPDRELRLEDIRPTAEAVAGIIQRTGHILPAFLQARIARVWGGLLDMTPDGLPVLDRVDPVDGLVITAGFSGHGFCLGPITGQIGAELAQGKQPSLPLEPFRWDRFQEARESETAGPELYG